MIDWKEKPNKLLAGVSSFGISGTNCHLVVEEVKRNQTLEVPCTAPLTFLFSVKQKESLIPLLEKHLSWFKKHPHTSPRNISYTLACGRNHYEHRVAFVATTLEELCHKIARYIDHPTENEPPQIQELVRLYLSKAAIHWKRYFPVGFGHKIPLPTYAFHQRRHWPKLEVEKAHSIENRLKSIFYQLEWHEETAKFSDSALNEQRKKQFLCFMHPNESHEAFADYIEAQGVSLLRVYTGKEFAIDQRRCHINPESASDYERLVDRTLSFGSHSFGGVLHMWDCLPVNALPDWSKIQQSQKLGAFALYHLIRALQKKHPQGEWRLINLTAYAQKVAKESHVVDPTRMPALGINKVASQEIPLVQSLAIDSELVQPLFQDLFKEIFATEAYAQAIVGYRNGKRYLQTLTNKRIDTLNERKSSIRQDGVYLIAGGAGYLGLNTARLLAEKERVKIALTGRKSETELSAKQKAAMEEIRKLGSEVIYLPGDVTDFNSCQQLISLD